jgi:hypothetical protein
MLLDLHSIVQLDCFESDSTIDAMLCRVYADQLFLNLHSFVRPDWCFFTVREIEMELFV